MALFAPIVATALLIAAMAAPAAAQGSLKQQAAGTWQLVSIKAGDAEPYGPTPHGVMFLDGNGHFSVSIVRAGIGNFAANSRTKGTDAENAAVVHGSLNYFGAYTIDEAEKSITVKIEAASYPNFNGATQKRQIAVNGDELTVVNAAASGGGAATQIWKRAK